MLNSNSEELKNEDVKIVSETDAKPEKKSNILIERFSELSSKSDQ